MKFQQPVTSANAPHNDFKFHLIQAPEDLCRVPGCPWDRCMLPIFRLKGISTALQCKLNANATEFVPATKRTTPTQFKSLTFAEVVSRNQLALDPVYRSTVNPPRHHSARKSLKVDTATISDILYSTPSPSPDALSLTFSEKFADDTENSYRSYSVRIIQSPEKVYSEKPMDRGGIESMRNPDFFLPREIGISQLPAATFDEVLVEHRPHVVKGFKRDTFTPETSLFSNTKFA
ncbi:hypothetical protein FRB91_006379 [Serendipita sp. 411]|nr:hypothetical protein FRB91_006379 [Serendipita sp. 411]